MRTAFAVALLLVFAGAAYGTTLNEQGPVVQVAPYNFGEYPGNVAVFMDYYPWGNNTVAEVLSAYGIPYSVYNSSSMGTLDLTQFDKVIIASNQDYNFYNLLQANRARFESFMAQGGCMLMCCAEYFGSGGSSIIWPGGFGHVEIECINAVQIEDPGHAVFNDPLPVSSGQLQGWYCSSHGSFNNMPAGSVTVITNQEYQPGTPCAFEFPWGNGGAYVIAQPIDWVGSSHPYTINVILYMCEVEPTPTDNSTWGEIKSLYR